MAKAKVLRTDYKDAAEDKLDTKATAVVDGLTAHAGQFLNPPVSVAMLTTLISNYSTKFSAYKRGGLDQKPAFVTAKAELIQALDDDADFVDEIADGSEQLIVNGGYVPTKTTKSPQAAPVKPEGVKARRGQATGQIFVECPAQKGGIYYGLVVCVGAGPFNINIINGQFGLDGTNGVAAFDFNKNRKKVMQGLETAINYKIGRAHV